MPREIIWEVTASQFETLAVHATLLENAEISQQDYLERLRSMGMPAAGPGTHVRIVLRVASKRIVLPAAPAAALRGGILPGLPN
jgi:hypothetical protein